MTPLDPSRYEFDEMVVGAAEKWLNQMSLSPTDDAHWDNIVRLHREQMEAGGVLDLLEEFDRLREAAHEVVELSVYRDAQKMDAAVARLRAALSPEALGA